METLLSYEAMEEELYGSKKTQLTLIGHMTVKHDRIWLKFDKFIYTHILFNGWKATLKPNVVPAMQYAFSATA